MARESSRLETLFDKQISSSRGYVTEAYKIEEIVREWELQTKSSFTLFTAPKHFGQLDPNDGSHKVMWEDPKIQYDGVPYFVLGQKLYDCRNGKDRKKVWKQKRKNEKMIEMQHLQDKFLFRQYRDVIETHETSDESGEGEHVEEEVRVTSPVSRQRLLFVHQMPWQRRLLERYGNDICLLDATHKTTHYALPLFFPLSL